MLKLSSGTMANVCSHQGGTAAESPYYTNALPPEFQQIRIEGFQYTSEKMA